MITDATARFEAAGNTIQKQTAFAVRERKTCVWCIQLLQYGRKNGKHKLCSPCAQIYTRKINTPDMLELRAVNLDLYQSAKADIFSDGVRHGV